MSLGRIFDGDAEGYDRARPSYPPAIVDAVPRGRLLEVGCGTGKLTKDLVARGDDVLGVDPGPNMAALARRFAPVEEATFEDWDPAGRTFDAVVAATAWHWVDPEVGVPKARSLAPVLCVIDTLHVLPEDGDPFFAQQHVAYGRWETDEGPPPHPEDVPPPEGADVVVRELVPITYTPEDFLAVLDTFSGHRALAPTERAGLYADLRALMGPTVTRHHLFQLARWHWNG